ncbi:uncharacterized protein G2W53_008490 [Senna tora]|uniref:Uncharacterized protein n=1 Tax=Senna tora TaxID=362788 RepID=A0A834X727_9FABA|nr:uncharacterized protein G2W53_008490 [Senna tora]
MSNQLFNLQSKLKEGVNDLNESEKDQHGWMIMRLVTLIKLRIH